MKTKQIADRLDVSVATIRVWTADVYPEFMSQSARGGGKTRQFTERDLRVLTAIAEMSNRNMGRAEIHAALTDMQAEGWIALPPVPGLPPEEAASPMIPREHAEMALAKQKEILDIRITQLETEIDVLRDALHDERAERQRLQSDLLTKERQLGEALGQLATIESATESERSNWLQRIESERATWRQSRRLMVYVMIAVALAAAALLIAVLLLALGGGA